MKIHIPTPLRAYTDKQETVTAGGTTVAAGLENLVQQFPAMRQHLFTPDGKLRSFVNVYVNDEDLRYLPEKENTPVDDAAELTIIPSIAGGLAGMYETTAQSVAQSGECPNPAEDLAFAHELLGMMDAQTLLQATHALEDLLSESPARRGPAPSAAETSVGIDLDVLLKEYGLTPGGGAAETLHQNKAA